MEIIKDEGGKVRPCLNPYSNGMLTWNTRFAEKAYEDAVLILILMECSLGVFLKYAKEVRLRLNPYSNGMLTWTAAVEIVTDESRSVLILILMECSLGCQTNQRLRKRLLLS